MLNIVKNQEKTIMRIKSIFKKVCVIFFSYVSFAQNFSPQSPIFIGSPFESNMLSNEITLNWKTNIASTGIIKYGLTYQFTDSILVSDNSIDHSVQIKNLKPATAYYYQIGASDSTGIRFAPIGIFSSASSENSSGAMYVYFSKYVNTSVSLGENGTTANLSEKFIEKINGANYSIDIALYSFSGTVGNNIAQALIAAKNRGVKIRMIMESDNATSTALATVKANGIPFIDDKFDPLNNGSGLMHNKFGIFDFRNKDAAEDDWVWFGSWNATDPGTNNDAQNAVTIQDQALANTYTIEFEEMWGSSTEIPNASNSKFGPRKTNNTPHRFIINNVPVESYFSPSDGTTNQIVSKIQKATSSVHCALLSFTKDELGQALIAKHNEGKKVRVLMDNSSDTGNEFLNLQNAGVDVLLKKNLGGLLHHKYAIIDADKPSTTNIVVTGSHNWSNSAETVNGENTIIIQSKRIANLFFQEFKARYIEAGGVAQLTNILSFDESRNNFYLNQNYPNPFNSETEISFNILKEGKINLSVYDLLGREVKNLINENKIKGAHKIKFNSKDLPAGIYFFKLSGENYSSVKTMHLIK